MTSDADSMLEFWFETYYHERETKCMVGWKNKGKKTLSLQCARNEILGNVIFEPTLATWTK